jgi:MSHA biogenesis protein MshO
MNVQRHSRARGFTLIELVVALVVGAIIFGLMGMMIAAPIDSFFDQSRRARLSEAADAVWQNIDRDVRAALPEHVRWAPAGNFVALEMLSVVNNGRYAFGTPMGAALPAFTTAGNFDLANVTNMLAIVPDPIPPNGAYAFGAVMTPPVTAINVTPAGAAQQVTINPPMTFSAAARPRRRAFFVSGAVSYLCDTIAGTVTRYSGYNINAAQPVAPGAFVGGQAVLIATNVTACVFAVTPGNANNGGVVTVRYTITTPNGESMTFLHEARVENPA